MVEKRSGAEAEGRMGRARERRRGGPLNTLKRGPMNPLTETSPSGRVAPLDRRLFLKAAALGIASMTVLGIDSVAYAAKASDETLAALDSAQAEYEAAMAELQSIGAQLEDAQYRLSECQAELAATEEQIAVTQDTIAQRQAELSEAQDVLAERMRASYTAGSTEMLDVLLNSTSFDDFVSRVYYTGKVSDADAAAIQDVKDIKAQLEQEEAALEAQKAQQEQLVAEQQELTDSLAATQDYYESYTAGLSAQVTQLMEQAAAELAAAQQAEYEAAQAAAAAAAAQAAAEQGASSSGGSDYSSDSGSSSGGSDYSSGSGSSSGGGSSYSGGNHVYSVADIAAGYIGVPYVWGGTDPSGFDCSGLAQYCYAMAGYSIGRTTYDQIANIQARGQMVYDMSQLQPGDLVFPHSGHVGIYVGGGSMIHAPYPGTSVQYSGVYQFSYGGCPV